MPRIGIALGSNLGDRLAHLQAARNALREIATVGAPFLQAFTYQTKPLHCPPDSPLFYNSALELTYDGSSFDLLEITKSIEIKLGRTAHPERNAPRIIDVDLLYCGDEMLDTPRLTLPHPRIAGRQFVLQPLADIRPNLILPGNTQTILELLENLQSTEPPLLRIKELDPESSQS